MPKGGRRPGAGRPKGATDAPWTERQRNKVGRPKGSGNKLRAAKLVRAAYESGEIMPLEVQLEAMRHHWENWLASNDEASLREANVIAQGAAPYCHPRLQAIDQRTTLAGDTLSELLRLIDGRTTGITRGLAANGSPLAIEQSVRNSGQGGEQDSVPPELGASGVAE